MYDDIYESPKQLIHFNGISSDHIPDKKNKFLKNKSAGITQKGGRIEGLKILNSFLDERSKNYLKNIYEEIEVNSLKSGLFFLVINEGEKLLEVKKIIIQN